MSSTYIIEPHENEKDSKKDDNFIIVINDDGTMAVDQETLQNLLINKSNANVSVVRVGQTENDGNLTFTVDPSNFEHSDSPNTAPSSIDTNLDDPFMAMDPEQLEKLETALQSEEAKQILGENVAAMLDMLTVEEHQNSIRYAVELDHCYTSRSSPLDPEPLDPLPIVNSPENDNTDMINLTMHHQSQSTVFTAIENSTQITASPVKSIVKTKQPVGRPRKTPISNSQIPNAPKSSNSNVLRNLTTLQLENRKSTTVNQEEENKTNDLSSSTESSDSETSDNDSDFGPRGPRRSGVRARGGRRGLTTRGGSMSATRRRGASKRMDVDQTRKHDSEMAAVVNTMKHSEKSAVDDYLSESQLKKQIKINPNQKKEEGSLTHQSSDELLVVPENNLQTTNQAKANLINANMIKGDMILTKPGQLKNQKVYFIKKKVIDKPEDIKSTFTIASKDLNKSANQIQTKLITSQHGKLMAVTPKSIINNSPQVIQSDADINTIVLPSTQSPAYTQLVQKQLIKSSPVTSSIKIKPTIEVKKDKKKLEGSFEPCPKLEEPLKIISDVKPSDGVKKQIKKDPRKSLGTSVSSLEPALFSTPDIIRRVGSNNESKGHDSNVSFSSGTSISNASESTLTSSTVVSSDVPFKSNIETLNPEVSAETNNLLSQSLINSDVSTIMFDSDSLEEKSISKLPVTDDLSLDPASQTVINEEIRKSDDSVQNIVSDQNGMEETEHLLATLEMEASKHEEELLAEALLLQEQLDVDLTDTATLDESTNVVPDSLLGTSFNTEKISAIATQSFPDETVERVTNIDNLADSHEAEQLKKKNVKEAPSQIFRGGRIITLPPIEAPATRSKKLQVKSESSSKLDDEKKSDKVKKQITQANQIEDMESEMEDDDEEQNSDSEDDPNRLWCICKQPHNNRFMICCDVCEDWFHGKCVNVTKTTGKQMEEKGLEWVCPNCTKKKLVQPASTITKSLTIKSPKTESHTQISNTETSLTQSSDGQAEVALNVKQNALSNLAVTQCVVCKKEARSSSIYCSDACILAHAEETSVKDKQVVQSVSSKLKLSLSDTSKSNSEARVIVFEKKTGTVLTGVDAPMASNLKAWLKEHPTFEVARSSNLNILQIGDKMVSAIQTSSPGKMVKPNQQQSKTVQPKMVFTKVVGSKQTVLTSNNKKITVISNLQNANIISKSGQIKQILVSSNKSQPILKQTTLKNVMNQNKTLPIVIKQTPVKKQEPKCSTPPAKTPQKSLNLKKSEPEPTIRLNVRKTLTELLSTRIKETDDLRLSKEEIENLALKIELEMYKYFRDTGAKYKAKYRSLLFNIKDSKNLTLFRKIADKSLTPDAVVKLSPEEMASQELAEWREKETQHQLEMIKKNELDLMAQAKSIVVKTHKGEQIIENDGGIEAVDPKTPVQDIVTVLNYVDNTSLDTLDEKDDTLSSSFEDVKKIKRNDDKQMKSKDREKEKDGHRSRKNKEHDKDSKKDTSSSKRKHRSKDRNRDRRRSKDEKRDKERSRERDRDKDKDKDKNKNKNKNKSKDKDRSRKSSKSRSSSHSKSSHKEKQYKDKEKKRNEHVDDSKRDESKKKETSPVQTGKLTEDRLWRHVEEETTANTLDGNDSDVSDREPSSTVNLESVDMNDELETEKDTIIESKSIVIAKDSTKNVSQTVWRGFINMIDVAKFFITAQEVSGQAKELMEDLPDTFEVVGRISHETVWDYISKMKKTGSKEIVIIRFTAANDEEKIPYITLYSYLNSRSRLGVVGNVSKNIKDFYIMPFSSQSQLPPVLFPLNGVGLEEQRPHLLLGIIVQNKRKRLSHNTLSIPLLPKVPKKDSDRSYTPPPVNIATDKLVNSTDVISEKSTTNQLTVNSFNKAHVGVSRKIIDSATISKIVPELSDKIDLTSSEKPLLEKDDDDEPYSPGDIDDDIDDNLLSPSKNSNELQRKMDEINRQIEEQKQQIQSISSSFLGESVPTLPGLGLDPSDNDLNEAYSPTDVRSFTPPPQGISKFTQPILDKVSNITIPPNLQEILANVKRQECSKFDPYLPSKPSASFLTSINSLNYQKEKTYTPTAVTKESKSTLRSLSDFDLIKKAEEELAAVTSAPIMPIPNMKTLNSVQPFEIANSEFSTSSMDSSESTYPPKLTESVQMSRISEQPKPPGLEDEELPTFPSVTPPTSDAYALTLQKGVSQSGIMSMKRKVNDDDSPLSHIKTPRVKSRWSQETSD